MKSLLEQLQEFAQERGGTLRVGPQPRKPVTVVQSAPAAPAPAPEPRDPYIEYTDDYSLWVRERNS